MSCKVDTLVERYGLTVPTQGYDSVDDYLVERWTGADGRSADGYKTLTDWFNVRLLGRIYEKHDRETIPLHVEREYELLTGEGDSRRAELAAALSTDGLDIEDVERELVSWSTMRHHLKDCLDAEKETQSATTDWEANTVEMARELTAEKTRSVLSSLTSKGELRNGDAATVDVEVTLGCPECSVQVPFENAVERGYVCETHSDSESSIRERVQYGLAAIVLTYGLLGVLYVLTLDSSLLSETVATAVL
ncbi:MAG: rod-determining factor RdfA [Halapricum sp.]